MYDSTWCKPLFYDKVNRFIEAVEKYAMTKNKNKIHSPCNDCKNNLAWKDVSTIRSRLSGEVSSRLHRLRTQIASGGLEKQ
jgi:hypothetical protein